MVELVNPDCVIGEPIGEAGFDEDSRKLGIYSSHSDNEIHITPGSDTDGWTGQINLVEGPLSSEVDAQIVEKVPQNQGRSFEVNVFLPGCSDSSL